MQKLWHNRARENLVMHHVQRRNVLNFFYIFTNSRKRKGRQIGRRIKNIVVVTFWQINIRESSGKSIYNGLWITISYFSKANSTRYSRNTSLWFYKMPKLPRIIDVVYVITTCWRYFIFNLSTDSLKFSFIVITTSRSPSSMVLQLQIQKSFNWCCKPWGKTEFTLLRNARSIVKII